MQVALTLKSSNKKTGPIPVSTTTRDSCPDTCPFKKDGCYADGGPLAIHWNHVTAKTRGTNWSTFCKKIESLPSGQLWRHNQAGDLPVLQSRKTNLALGLLDKLINANRGKRGFTYTHHSMKYKGNRHSVKHCNDSGFTVNLSANSIDEVDSLVSLDIGPVVVTIPEGLPRTMKTAKGVKIIQCPATYKDDTTCETCKLCAIPTRKTVIAFPFHGSKKRSLNERYREGAE
jgi:hypothetical protein